MNIPTNARTIWEWFKSNTNLPDYGIAALMGNFYAESALEPVRKQGDFNVNRTASKEYAAKADSGDLSDFCAGKYGWGLAQWTFNTRCRGLADFAAARGKSVGDLETQLAFCWKELTGDFSGILYTLRTATNIRTASDEVLKVYENPLDQSSTVQELRARYSQEFYDALHSDGITIKLETEETTEQKTTIIELLERMANDLAEIKKYIQEAGNDGK